MELLKGYTDAEVRKIAARPTPQPMVGEWTLTAPDGRTWKADNPMRCLTAEVNDRVPPLVALARIKRAVMDGDNEEAASAAPVTNAAREVLAERLRQVEVERWTPEHDDEHENGELAKAAACYALQSALPGNEGDYLRFWPSEWDPSWWRPKDRRNDLKRAAAMLIAEIERIDRIAP